jgi:hypothetical protein
VLAGDGLCPVVIRLENGLLGEIVNTFQEIVGGFKLPVGSVVALVSTTHLLLEGLDAYAEAMVGQLNKISRIFRGGGGGLPPCAGHAGWGGWC